MSTFHLVDYMLGSDSVGVEGISYKLLILAPADTSPTLEKLNAAIRSKFAALNPPQTVSTSLEDDSLTVTVNKFRFVISFSCEPRVLTESREIAERFGSQNPSRTAIAAASCRFELNSGSDPNMEHFNDAVLICQAAKSLGPIYIFDPLAMMFV